MEERGARRGVPAVRRSWPLPVALLLLTGCVYYNGMYNANRLAKQAKKAQREGRTFQAQGYWAQAEVRADTVIARYPDSKWADDAQLIRGEAMVSRGDCPGAIPALEQATLSQDSPEVVQQAQILLGGCRLKEGNLSAADRAFSSLLESPDSSVRRMARINHARILRLDGQCQAAIEALDGLDGAQPDAERAICYSVLGDVAAARPLLDQALARGDTTFAWGVALAGVGRVDPGLASSYTSAVVAIPGLRTEERDGLLVADGVRLLPVNADSGLARLRAAAAANPVTDNSLLARLTIARYLLGQAETVPALETARPELTPLSEFGGVSAIAALNYLRVLDRAQRYLDSVPPGAPRGDLATFMLAESIRDGLPAPRVAAQLFASIPTYWPESPYAPKALLALAGLQPDNAEMIIHAMECVYPGNPYLLLAEGEVTPAVLALEDSLQNYTGGAGAGQRAPGARRAPPPAPAGQRQQDDLK